MKKAIIQAKINNIPNMTQEEILKDLHKIWQEEATKEVIAEALDRIKTFRLYRSDRLYQSDT
tara:strand:- start:5597 stop:5782 length:186 start_codon:yes stop_codon:yes gene_type:complete